MKIKPQQKKNIFMKILRIMAYLEIMLVCVIVTFCGNGVRPLLLIPFAVCMASWKDEITSGAVGLISGFIIDITTNRLPGFNALILTCACVLISVMYIYFLRRKFFNFLILTAAVCAVQTLLTYVFVYKLWDYEGAAEILRTELLRSAVLTVVFSFVIYLLVNFVNRKLKPYQMTTVEEVLQYEHGDE